MAGWTKAPLGSVNDLAGANSAIFADLDALNGETGRQ